MESHSFQFTRDLSYCHVLDILPPQGFSDYSQSKSRCNFTTNFPIYENIVKQLKAFETTETKGLIIARIGCVQNNDCSKLIDSWPTGLTVQVNGRDVQFREITRSNGDIMMTYRRDPHSIDITDKLIFPARRCNLRRNSISISWIKALLNPISEVYYIGIYFVRNVSVNDLAMEVINSRALSVVDVQSTIAKRLGVKAPQLFIKNEAEEVDETNSFGVVDAESDDDDCIAITDELTVNLLCPLLKTRIQTPARSAICAHLESFCLFNFLTMNRNRQEWKCPICKLKFSFDQLCVDNLLKSVLEDPRSNNCEKVFFHGDGSWLTDLEKQFKIKKETADAGGGRPNDDVDDEIFINLCSSEEEEEGDNDKTQSARKTTIKQEDEPTPVLKNPRKRRGDFLVSNKSWKERKLTVLGPMPSKQNTFRSQNVTLDRFFFNLPRPQQALDLSIPHATSVAAALDLTSHTSLPYPIMNVNSNAIDNSSDNSYSSDDNSDNETFENINVWDFFLNAAANSVPLSSFSSSGPSTHFNLGTDPIVISSGESDEDVVVDEDDDAVVVGDHEPSGSIISSITPGHSSVVNSVVDLTASNDIVAPVESVVIDLTQGTSTAGTSSSLPLKKRPLLLKNPFPDNESIISD